MDGKRWHKNSASCGNFVIFPINSHTKGALGDQNNLHTVMQMGDTFYVAVPGRCKQMGYMVVTQMDYGMHFFHHTNFCLYIIPNLTCKNKTDSIKFTLEGMDLQWKGADAGMMPTILLSIFLLSNFGSSIFVKQCSNQIGADNPKGYGWFLFANSIVSCLFFWLSNGLQLRLNWQTVLYSILFAVVVLGTLILSLYVYRFVSVAGVTIVRNAGSLVLGAIAGSLLFQEQLNAADFIRILLLAGAVVMFAVSTGMQNKKYDQKRNKRSTVALILLILANGAAVIIQKYYALDTQVTDDNSFFFLTNGFLLIVSLVWLAFGKTGKAENAENTGKVKTKVLLSLPYVANTVCSNIGSLTTVLLLQTMDISLYMPLSIAFGIVSGVGASLVFREKVDRWVLSAAVLSIVAALV